MADDVQDDPINDLNSGPWPGPIAREVQRGEVRFGDHRFLASDLVRLQVKKHSRERRWNRTASATLTNAAAGEQRWDYAAEVAVLEDGVGLFRGVCTSAAFVPGEHFALGLHDWMWHLDNRLVGPILPFGMEQLEIMYWATRAATARGVHIPGLVIDQRLRPFTYAMPVIGLTANGRRKSLAFGDIGITSGEMDNLFYPVIEQLGIQEQEPLWKSDNPRVFGVVFATDFLEAEKLAIERARFTVDIINFALTGSASHWEDRYDSQLLEWERAIADVRVRLSDWIVIREVEAVKGWARVTGSSGIDRTADLNNAYERLRAFFRRFQNVASVQDAAAQLGQRQASAVEEKLLMGVERALRWHSIGLAEPDLRDRLLADWIALEAILNSIDYPGVFAGSRRAVQESLEDCIKKIDYPQEADSDLAVTADFLRARVGQGEWPLRRKLLLFARNFGIKLRVDDYKLVGSAAQLRNNLLHQGRWDAGSREADVQRLAYLVERLLMAGSLGAYRDIEGRSKPTLTFGVVGPRGGGRPLWIDGRRVPYRAYLVKRDSGDHDLNTL